MSQPDPFRSKKTDVENVLPAISTWPTTKLRQYRYTDLDGNRVRLNPAEFAHLDPWPLPKSVDREGYATEENSDRYWISGLADWKNVCCAVERHLEDAAKIRLLDFGCASGRVLRHVLMQSGSNTEIWGTDLAPANIEWIQRYLPAEIQCEPNSVTPELRYEDNFFDIITAFSVFTHINANEIDWLLELKRITRPGGLLYITIHNDATWAKTVDRPATIRRLEQQNSFEDNLVVNEKLLSEPMPRERLVFRKSHDEVYNCNVWHRNDYILKTWSEHFEILQIADCAHANYQSPVIMRVT